jgi:hypothetical protein
MNGSSCRPSRLIPSVIARLISASDQLPKPACGCDVMFADTAAQS